MMGIAKRISDIVKGNLNEILDQYEKPEVVLEQLMAELREDRRGAKAHFLRCLADEKRLELRIQEHQEQAQQWKKRAELAVLRDEDDLAREAIQRRKEHAAIVVELTRQWEEHHRLVGELKEGMDLLDRRMREAELQKERLLDEYRLAEAQRKAMEALGRATDQDQSEQLARVENKIRNARAAALAAQDFGKLTSDDKFRRLEIEGGVDDELLELKLQAGKVVPTLPASPQPPQPALSEG